MTSCEDIRERLTSYLDGDLDPDRGTVVRGHLRTCDACRQVATDEAVLRDGLRKLPAVDPPASLWANVQARLAETEIAESKRPAWRRVMSRWLPAAPRFAIGGVLATAAVGLVLWKIRPSSDVRPASTESSEPAAQVARSSDPKTMPRVTDNPSPEIESSGNPLVPPTVPPVGPANGVWHAVDATADLAGEPARITATYESTTQELLALATAARPGWSDDAKAAFDAKVAGFRDEIKRASDERTRQKSYRAMIRYVQNAVVRDDIMLARAP